MQKTIIDFIQIKEFNSSKLVKDLQLNTKLMNNSYMKYVKQCLNAYLFNKFIYICGNDHENKLDNIGWHKGVDRQIITTYEYYHSFV